MDDLREREIRARLLEMLREKAGAGVLVALEHTRGEWILTRSTATSRLDVSAWAEAVIGGLRPEIYALRPEFV